MIDQKDQTRHLTNMSGKPNYDRNGIIGDLVFEYEMPHLVRIEDSAGEDQG